MLKTSAQIADSVLEKIALRRSGKDFVRAIEAIVPGFRKEYKRVLSRNEDLRNAALNYSDKDTGVLRDIAKDITGIPALNASFPLIQSGAQGLRVKMINAFRRNALALDPTELNTKLTFSGRHSLRPGEVGIPATGTTERIVNPGAARTPFELGPRSGEPLDVFLSSRHPDVAAAYSVGSGTAYTPKTGRVFALRRKGLRGVEVPGDHYTGQPPTMRYGLPHWGHPKDALRSGTPKKLDAVYGSGSMTDTFSQNNPRYEMVSSARRPRAVVGEYGVREARGPKGEPLYAIRHISGELPERVFK
jgi:hypothetical protein